MSKELEQKSAALEKALEKQLSSFKKGSEDWVKVGAVVAVSAMVEVDAQPVERNPVPVVVAQAKVAVA